jgi:hypothetical protein
MPLETEILAALKSIDASLKAIANRTGTSAAPTGPSIASDADLDGQYGDPEVKAKDPRDWTGPTMRGKRFSQCPAEYLDMVADRLDYFCSQNAGGSEDEQKKAKYQRLDAARARGWAKRIRAGWKPPAPPSDWGNGPDDTI